MDVAASPSADSTCLAELQRAVQLKLGGCIWRLQQYERLLKAMVASTDLAGEPAQLQALRDALVASVHKTTLGGLVSLFTGGYLLAEEGASPTPETDDKAPGDKLWFSFQQRIAMSAERHEAITTELKELAAHRRLRHGNRYDNRHGGLLPEPQGGPNMNNSLTALAHGAHA